MVTQPEFLEYLKNRIEWYNVIIISLVDNSEKSDKLHYYRGMRDVLADVLWRLSGVYIEEKK